MKTPLVSLLCGLALPLFAVGCGNNSGGGTKADMGDMAKGSADLSTGGDVDLAMGLTGKASGEPCKVNTDCAKGLGTNQNATCVKMTDGITWPEGYCTSECRPLRNDGATGINPDCPGSNATCDGEGAKGVCSTLCETSATCRTGYACFVLSEVASVCLPRGFSECDPRLAGSCYSPPMAKRCPAPKPDGGVCYEDTCVNIGDGTVGGCSPGCNPFELNLAKNGCPGMDDVDCHASDVTGEGFCTSANMSGAKAGSDCGDFYSDCPSGYGCGTGDKCWRYCTQASAAKVCAPAKRCIPFTKMVNGKSVNVDAAGTGICEQSA